MRDPVCSPPEIISNGSRAAFRQFGTPSIGTTFGRSRVSEDTDWEGRAQGGSWQAIQHHGTRTHSSTSCSSMSCSCSSLYAWSSGGRTGNRNRIWRPSATRPGQVWSQFRGSTSLWKASWTARSSAERCPVGDSACWSIRYFRSRWLCRGDVLQGSLKRRREHLPGGDSGGRDDENEKTCVRRNKVDTSIPEWQINIPPDVNHRNLSSPFNT